MSRDEKLRMLRNVPLFGSCSRSELVWIGRITEVVTVGPGHPLQTEDHRPGEVAIVLRGCAITSSRGRPLGLIGPGELCGDTAVLRSQPATCSVVAVEHMGLVCIEARSFTAALALIPSFSAAFMRQWARRPLPHELDAPRRRTASI